MKKILLLLCVVALWSCTDYAADWDSKYENSFAANGESRICMEGETTIINQNDCVTGFVCANNSWIVASGPQCQSASAQVCVEGSTTALVAGNCIVNYICSNNAWVQYGELQCVEVSAPKVCNEGETVSLTENDCVSNYVCSGNAWVLNGNPVCATNPSSTGEANSVYPQLSATKVSSINCSKSMYCPQDCRNSSNSRCGKVYTGLDDGSGTQGWFWTYSDADANGGTSSFYWPEGEGKYGFEPTSRDKLGYLKGIAKFGKGYDYPYARMGFHIKGEDSDVDITSWNGMCLVYAASQDFYLTLRFLGDDKSVAYDYFQAKIPAASSKSLVNVSWNDFVQEGWGKSFALSVALLTATKFEFTFKGVAGTSNEFSIYAIGKNGTCK